MVRRISNLPLIDVNAGPPLPNAAKSGHENIVYLLLEQPNIDINKGAPLAHAAGSSRENIVRLLLKPNLDITKDHHWPMLL